MNRKSHGFTLLEMLVAVLLIAILFTLVLEAIGSATDARELTLEKGGALADLQRAFIWMDQDINQIANRSIRDAYGSRQQAVVYHNQSEGRILEFTRSGWPNPIDLNRSDMVRVAYVLEPDQAANSRRKADDKPQFSLYRLYWRDADRSVEEPTRKRRIARGITAFKVRFMDDKKRWKGQWPPLNASTDSAIGLPRALELELELQGWGKLRRVFRVVAAHGL